MKKIILKSVNELTETYVKPHFLIILLMFSVAIMGIIFIQYIWTTSVRETQNQAKIIAMSAEAGIQKSLISNLNAHENDINLIEYQEIKNNLMKIVSICNNIRFAYICIKKNEKIYFLVDSEPIDSEDYSPPGQEYYEADEQTFSAFNKEQAFITEPTTDRWGSWVSVLVPMKDYKTGDTIAIFGIDYPTESWYREAIIRTIQAIVVVFFGLMIVLGFYFVLYQKNALKLEKLKLAEIDEQLEENKELFRTMFEQAPIGIAIVKDFKFYSSINSVFENILGRTKEELFKLKWTDLTHPDNMQRNLELYSQLKSGEIERFSIENRYIKPDGSFVWVHMVVANLRIRNQTEQTHLCIIVNIDEHMEAVKALHESERSKAVLLSHLPGMAYRCKYDSEWTMEFVSEGCFGLTGYKPESLIYNKEISFKLLIKPEYREVLWNEWKRILPTKKDFKFEYEITTATGEVKWVLELGQGIYDANGNVEALEGIVIDISQQRAREIHIQYINEHDFITGIYNRGYFEIKMKELDNQEFLPLSVITVDINGVRLINDAFGSTEGDKLIKETAEILKKCCRPQDVLARVGGDEFSLLLPNTDNEKAYEILNQIQNACSVYNENNSAKLYEVNLSIGYATKENAEDSIEQITKSADEYLRNRKLLNRKSYHNAIIASMMATVYEKSQETEEHAKRLVELSCEIGKKLNLSQKSIGELELFSMLHDIGKVGIDDRVLNKPGKLDDDEWIIMKKHPEIGYRIAKASSELEPIAEYILTHHERWDGKGYPQGLKEEEIPIHSRILAVVDAYDAMTEDRIYRKAMTKEAAIIEIMKNAGTQFDPYIVNIFIEMMH